MSKPARIICANCQSTGWISFGGPAQTINGVLHMRQRIVSCPYCNLAGTAADVTISVQQTPGA